MTDLLNRIKEFCSEYGFEKNRAESKLMIIDREHETADHNSTISGREMVNENAHNKRRKLWEENKKSHRRCEYRDGKFNIFMSRPPRN